VQRAVALLPVLSEARFTQVPVRSDLTCHFAKIAIEVIDRRSAPVPVSVVDAMYDEPRPPDESVRNHWIGMKVRVFLDVEVFLHLAAGIGEKRPLRANRGSEVVV